MFELKFGIILIFSLKMNTFEGLSIVSRITHNLFVNGKSALWAVRLLEVPTDLYNRFIDFRNRKNHNNYYFDNNYFTQLY